MFCQNGIIKSFALLGEAEVSNRPDKIRVTESVLMRYFWEVKEMFILTSTPGVDVRMSSVCGTAGPGVCAPSQEWSHPCDTGSAGQCSMPSH